MSPTAREPQASRISERMADRLAALGLTVASARARGRIELEQETGWLEAQVASAPAFAEAARHALDRLDSRVQPVELWPGVWITPLPQARRKRNRDPEAPRHFALVVGEAFLRSDQFRLVCDARRLDAQAAAARARRDPPPRDRDAERLAHAAVWMRDDDEALRNDDRELQTLSTQLCESYEELSLLYRISTKMTFDQPAQAFINDACAELCQVLNLNWLALRLVDDDPRMADMQNMAGHVFRAGEVHCSDQTLGRIGKALLDKLGPGAPPMVVDDAHALQIPHLPQLGTNVLAVCLAKEDKPVGVLFGADKTDGEPISSVEAKLCDSLASTLAMFLENRMLFEDTHAMFRGTLRALTTSIDAKDRYTRGHSDRVAMLARTLAQRIGIDEHTVERVYLSGLLHDIGKIGVPEAVLRKPGKLSTEEFDLIKQHPRIGANILEDIRQMKDLIPGVLHHHERWDGRGYPDGLSGEQIPLFGRLIGLADAFDAMSSNRTYRSALDHDRVLTEIEQCGGSQFDPELARVFVRLDFKPFFDMIAEHRASDTGE